MAIVKQAIREHDFIELLDPIRGWSAGTTGTVVSDYGDAKLVEISDNRGVMLDLIQVPEGQLRLIAKHSI